MALGENQKVTRQKKRRYNEMNHVTSVGLGTLSLIDHRAAHPAQCHRMWSLKQLTLVSPLGLSQDMADLAPIDQHLEKEHQEKTKVKNIQSVEMGSYEVRTRCPCPAIPSCYCALGEKAWFAARHAWRLLDGT